MMDKKKIRLLVKERKKDYSDAQLEQMSGKITARIRSLPQYREAETIFAYMDMPGEVKMRDFIRRCMKDGKTVAVPKIIVSETDGAKQTAPDGVFALNSSGKSSLREMRFFRILSFKDLQEGTMHIMEPDPRKCPCMDAEENALIIMPGVAFDTDRHRIGYGGGFYDRYLEAHPDHPTVAAAYGFQVFDRIPSEIQDIRPQILVTEEKIFL